MVRRIKIIECPRDAMQGIKQWIPTEMKIAYNQQLLRVGFDTLDCGSFVSPKAIPQMADTASVINALDLSETQTKLSVIVANLRGAETACTFPQIHYLGYPFSISENFQMRNTHRTIAAAFEDLKEIVARTKAADKELVVYLSMGFGNPYGDPWSVSIVEQWVERLLKIGVQIFSLSDTVGTAAPEAITSIFSSLNAKYKEIEFGAHFHTDYNSWRDKVAAAYFAGCRRFDGAIKGHGGCPMAKNELVGNMPTEKLISFFTTQKEELDIHPLHFEIAYNKSHDIFMPKK